MLLAGLIQETQTVVHNGIPILDQIPVMGKAFGSNNNSIDRTELILFIGLRSSTNGADASVVAEELRSKMRGGKLGRWAPSFFDQHTNRTMQ